MRAAWRSFYRGWMRFAHVLGTVNTAILLTLVYVLAVGPMRLVTWLMRDDALGRRRRPSYWHERTRRPADAAIPERQRMRWQF